MTTPTANGEISAADYLPGTRSLRALRSAAHDCRGCPLWKDSTQTVFKWRPRGKRRLHQTPRAGEVEACRPWLEAEIEAVEPRAMVALGATATKALFGASIKVTRDRGRLLESPLAPLAAVTIHPSAVLRVRDREERHDAIAAMVEDLGAVSAALKRSSAR